MFVGLLRVMTLPILLVGLTWLGVVIYFQQSGHDLDGTGIVLWFVVLPLGLVAGWFLGRYLLGMASGSSSTAADGPSAVGQSSVAPTADSPVLSLAVLAAEFVTAGGNDPVQLQLAHREASLRPAPMAEVLDVDGLPVWGLACDQLAIDACDAWIARWNSSARASAGAADAHDLAQGARLLALLAEPLDRALAQLAALPVTAQDGEGASSDVARARPVVTKIFAPEAWQSMLAAYVRERAALFGKLNVGVVRAGGAVAEGPDPQFDAMRIADAFCAASTTQYAHSALLIIGCDSLVDAARVEAMERERQLFSASRQQGRMPGEAAAVLLAVSESLVGAEPAPLARMHRTAFVRRQKPVDAAGRTEASDLQRAVSQAIGMAKRGGDACGVVSDCDHRTAWQSELAQAITELFPALDPIADHLALGNALGCVGHASSTLSLCVAAALAAQAEQPILALSVDDAHERSGLILERWPSTQS